MLLAAARTILLEQGDPASVGQGISYDAWLVKTVVPMWIVGWSTVRVTMLMWRLGARRARREAAAAPTG